MILLHLLLRTASAGCPEVPYPPGVDQGAARVEAVLQVGEDGQVVGASGWDGPQELVDAVVPSLAECRLSGPAFVPWSWTFGLPPVNVAGVVRSRGDRAPVRATTVIVGDRLARTDDQGRFELRNVVPGELVVRLGDAAWRLPETTVALEAGERVDLDLVVTPGKVREDELVAIYGRDEPVGVVRTVGLDQAKGMPGTLGDPLRSLTGQPGLTRTPYDAGWLLVRGGEFDEVGLFLDGVPVPLVYHLGGFTSVLHPEMIEAVRFWPGLFPARYGDAISGAVDMVPREVGDRTRLVGGVNVVFAHAFAEIPTSFGGIAVAARRSYLDGVVGLVLGPEAAGIAPRFWDAQARATIGRSSLFFLVMADAIDAPSFSGDGVLTIDQDAAQAQAVVPIGEHVSVRPWIAWTRREVTGEDVTPQSVSETYPGLRVDARTDDDAPARLSVGLEGERRFFVLERDNIVRDAPLWTIDPYAGMAIGDEVEVWTEARLHTALVPDQPLRHAVSPRAGVRWDTGARFTLHAELGRLYQLPQPALLLGIAEGRYQPLEESDQLATGFRVGDATVSFEADAWTRRVSGLSELELDGSLGEALGRASGLETRVHGHVAGFDGTALYQYTRSQKREEQDEPWAPSAFEVPHRVELLAIQALPRAWTVSARFRLTSGYPRVPDVNGFQPTEAYDLLLQRSVHLDLPRDQERLAPYHALDVRAGRTFSFRTWQLEASLEVQNVYNRRVVEPVITGFGESRPSYGFGLPFLPIFALDGRFWPGTPP